MARIIRQAEHLHQELAAKSYGITWDSYLILLSDECHSVQTSDKSMVRYTQDGINGVYLADLKNMIFAPLVRTFMRCSKQVFSLLCEIQHANLPEAHLKESISSYCDVWFSNGWVYSNCGVLCLSSKAISDIPSVKFPALQCVCASDHIFPAEKQLGKLFYLGKNGMRSCLWVPKLLLPLRLASYR